jgi:hypothetical protein
MKRMAIEELAGKLDTLIDVAPREKVLLTRNGRPFAFVSDASKFDWEDIGYMNDPTFWQMIAERRKERGGISFEQVEAELMEREKSEKPARSTKKARSRRGRPAA